MSANRWPVWVWFGIGNGAVLAIGIAVVAWLVISQMGRDPVANAVAAKTPKGQKPAGTPAKKPEPAVKPVAANPVPKPVPTVADVIQEVDGGIVLLKCKNAAGQDIGLGSGFVFDKAGLVATSFHVLRRALKVEAVCVDGTTLEISGCRAWHEEGDLAILELASKPANLEVLRLATNTTRPAAAEVIAIGHPRGFKFTTTTGIISAVHATSDLPQPYRDFVRAPEKNVWIQTNAAISGGNSGGPLLNRAGEVVGINAWVADGQNLGFAVDVRHLIELAGQLQTPAIPLAELTGPEELLQSLITAYTTQREWLASEISKVKTEKAAQELINTRHPALDQLSKFIELAEKHRGRPVAFSAFSTICEIRATSDCPAAAGPLVKRAADRLVEEHKNDPRLIRLALRLGSSPLPEALDLARRLSTESGNRNLQAASLYSLAMGLLAKQEEDSKSGDEALTMLERLGRDYADVEFEGAKLGAVIEPILFNAKYLAIGRRPPAIEGPDQDGKDFKLSDYLGKVVVVDFWADWCPHCVRMYPLERKLVADYAYEPFVLLGVNCDEPGRFRRVMQQQNKVTWRNWPDGAGGKIAASWRVEAYPTLYVLDHEGVIRYINVRDQELVEAIKELVAKVPKKPETATPGKLVNASFETGLSPTWAVSTYLQRPEAVGQTGEFVKAGRQSLVIRSAEGDDVQCKQEIVVKSGTRYRLRGWAKTRDVVVTQQGGTTGACLFVEDVGISDTLTGTADWRELKYEFETGERTTIKLGVRLGFNGSTSSGTAWFDELQLEELPAAESGSK